MATTAATPICPQGHGPGAPGAQFCTACGTRLVADFAPVNAPAIAPFADFTAPPEPQSTPGFAPIVAPSAGSAFTSVATPTFTAVPVQAATAVPAFVPLGQPVAAAATEPAVPPPVAMPAPAANNQTSPCHLCGGDGSGLDPAEDVCPKCAWLRPLLPGYQLDRKVFLWAQDGQAMARLQSLPALHAVVRSVSDKVGRPWIESTFNAIRLGPRQLPDVWKQAVLAARIMGLPKLPDVYISGDQMWNTYTYGTENSAFIVLGTSHLINFANDELLFVLAREMGHCCAGHALWKTVTRFIAGDTSIHGGLLSDGLINAISPSKLIHGALDLPLMAWSRQSEITADRAGLLAVGDEGLARRVLLAWSVRSARLLQQVNIDEWMKQEDASDDQMTRFSEMTTSSSMYTTRRLRLLHQSAEEPELMRWSQGIQPVRERLAPKSSQLTPGLGVGTVRAAKTSGPGHPANAAEHQPLKPAAAQPGTNAAAADQPGKTPPGASAPTIRVFCTKCKAPVRIPLSVLKGKTSLNVRCPQCKSIFAIRPKAPAAAPHAAPAGAETTSAAPPQPAGPQG